jgi:hypothetical protein
MIIGQNCLILSKVARRNTSAAHDAKSLRQSPWDGRLFREGHAGGSIVLELPERIKGALARNV